MVNNYTILVDPMFSQAGLLDPVSNSSNTLRNPLSDLPLNVDEIINDVDIIVITHLHRDHFDQASIDILPKHIPILCQPEDERKIKDFSFTNVIAIHDELEWNCIHFKRTGGQHGIRKLATQMGPVSGFIIKAKEEPVIYIIGDSVWCKEVEETIKIYLPNVIVVNAGAAQFISSDPITMDVDDVLNVSDTAPASQIVCVHMDSWNHCILSREDLMAATKNKKNITIPYDGELLSF